MVRENAKPFGGRGRKPNPALGFRPARRFDEVLDGFEYLMNVRRLLVLPPFERWGSAQAPEGRYHIL